MRPGPLTIDRRAFIASAAAAALNPYGLLGAQGPPRIELGAVDGSVGGNQFTPLQYLDHFSSRKLAWAMILLFLAIADKGVAKPATPRPEGRTAGQQRIADLEVSVKYTRELLQRM
jgi:hypothetical protein